MNILPKIETLIRITPVWIHSSSRRKSHPRKPNSRVRLPGYV